jgi:phosphoadenosine phosphosulfate reductase
LDQLAAHDVIEWAGRTFGDRLAIATSFQKEGMVLVDLAARIRPDIRVFTIDTGRLPEATYRMVDVVRDRYGIRVEVVFPEAAEVESMAGRHGPNLFYREVPLRMLCCQVRKVRPLARKLQSLDAWIVGLRRSQAESRAGASKVDMAARPVKISPLADWTDAEVDEYIRLHDVPVHPLYAEGYTSIGCAPCTRAAREGEHARAGRWWWEQAANKECGIHFSANGRAERQVDVLLKEVLEHVS